MSQKIEIMFKDGETARWEHQGRSGGSYTISLSFEGAFAIVTDEWGKRVCYPANEIASIIEEQRR